MQVPNTNNVAVSEARRSVEGSAATVAGIGAVLFAVGAAVLWIRIGDYLGFYTLLNDFWGTFFLGDHLSWADRRSLHNGFFPLGYPALLRLIQSDEILVWAFALSAISAAVVLYALYRWLVRYVNPWLALMAVAACAAHPLFFQHAITSGPDMLATCLAVSGVACLVTGMETESRRRALLAGALLGAAGLCRYQAFPFAGIALISALAMWPGRWRPVLFAGTAFVVIGGVQVGANLAAGVAPFQTVQGFNVYKTFNAVDWWHLRAHPYPASVIEAIRLGPERFWSAYTAGLKPLLYLAVGPVLATVVARGALRRLMGFTALLLIVYLAVQAVGGSPRGPLLVLPLFFASVAVGLHTAVSRVGRGAQQPVAIALGACLLIAALGRWVPVNRQLVSGTAAVVDLWTQVETLLKADGVQHPAQVFTDSFDFYFTTVRSSRSWDYRPRNTGGWAEIDLHGYEQVHPPLATTSLPAFLDDCRKYGVTHLVLTATAQYVLPPLGAIQTGGPLPPGLEHVAALPGVRIVSIVAPPAR